jgi:preprotein translocase subunit YajC
VGSLIPFVVFIVVIIGLFAFSARARRRQAQTQVERSERISVGSDVMTTSGLYGTVVSRNDDDTVQMSIAPGVEVKWALAALRDVESLPSQYRRTEIEPADESDDANPGIDFGKPRRGDTGGVDPSS